MSLILTGVSHRYPGSDPVLRGVTVAFDPDETIAITGPSGSGKTTLLSIVGGLLSPIAGRVSLDDNDITGIHVPPGTFGWIFQTINLLSRRSVLENVAIGLYSQGCSLSDAAGPSRDMLTRVGLGGFETHSALTLSGGEAQRVGVARALVGRPRYVLADEPTGQLDRSTSDVVAEVLFSSRPSGTTLIIVTHDESIAQRCQRRFGLVNGRLQENS